jgi:hypothetical protein
MTGILLVSFSHLDIEFIIERQIHTENSHSLFGSDYNLCLSPQVMSKVLVVSTSIICLCC